MSSAQAPMPKVTLLEADCDPLQSRLKSFSALVEFGQRQARIELTMECHVSYDHGLEECIRMGCTSLSPLLRNGQSRTQR